MTDNVNFKLLNDYVVVALEKAEERTDSGIIKAPSQIEEEESKQDGYLTVVAVSDDVKDIKVGYRVMVSRMSNILIEGVTYGLLDKEGLICYKIKGNG